MLLYLAWTNLYRTQFSEFALFWEKSSLQQKKNAAAAAYCYDLIGMMNIGIASVIIFMYSISQ